MNELLSPLGLNSFYDGNMYGIYEPMILYKGNSKEFSNFYSMAKNLGIIDYTEGKDVLIYRKYPLASLL